MVYQQQKYDFKNKLLEIKTNPQDSNFILSLHPQTQDNQTINNEIWSLRHETYRKMYPNVIVNKHDKYDKESCIIFTRNNEGKISSTARIAYNGQKGIPEQQLIPNIIKQYEEEGIIFAELGRFVINDDARGVLKNYFRAFYHCGLESEIDLYLMFVRQKWISFYQQFMDATIISDLEGVTFGSQSNYACMTWNLAKTKPDFFKWCETTPYQNHFSHLGGTIQ